MLPATRRRGASGGGRDWLVVWWWHQQQVAPDFSKAEIDQELMRDWCTSTYTHHVGTYGRQAAAGVRGLQDEGGERGGGGQQAPSYSES